MICHFCTRDQLLFLTLHLLLLLPTQTDVELQLAFFHVLFSGSGLGCRNDPKTEPGLATRIIVQNDAPKPQAFCQHGIAVASMLTRDAFGIQSSMTKVVQRLMPKAGEPARSMPTNTPREVLMSPSNQGSGFRVVLVCIFRWLSLR